MAAFPAVAQDGDQAAPEPVLGQVLGADPLAPVAIEQAQVGTNVVNPRGTTAQPANPLITLGFSSQVLYEDDDDGDSQTTLGFGFSGSVFSETRSQRFRLVTSTLAEIGEDEVQFTDTLVNLSYAYFTRQTEISLDLGFSEFDVDDANTVLGAAFDAADLSTDNGQRLVSDARLRVVTGRGSRFRTNTTLGYRLQDFADTIDPGLVPETTLDAGTVLTFVIDPRVTLRTFASISQTEEEDALNTLATDIRYGIGSTFLIDRAWTADAAIAVTSEEVETDDGGGGRTVLGDDGFEFDLTLTRALNNGTLAFAYAHDQSEDDQIDSFSVAREMGLANGAALFASVGVISFETGDVLPLLGLTYQTEFLSGQTIALSLEQSGDQNDDDEDILRTQAGATYTHALTPTSSISVNGRVASIDALEGAAVDALNTSYGLRYTHDLTQDWALVAQADWVLAFEGGTQTDEETTLSIRLERTFSFRP